MGATMFNEGELLSFMEFICFQVITDMWVGISGASNFLSYVRGRSVVN